MAPARKRNDNEKHRASRWGPLFEVLIVSAMIALGVVFVLEVYIPNAQAAEEAQQRLKDVENELAEKKEALERKRAFIRDLTGTTVNPDTVERELRQKYGWKKDGEWRMRQNADTE